MRDYRLPKSHRPSRSKPLLKSAARSHRKKISYRTRTSSSRGSSFLGSLLTKLVTLVIVVGVLMGLGWLIFQTILPQLVPLNHNKNIVIVSSSKESPTQQIMIVRFKPNDQVAVAHLIPAEQSVKVVGGFGEYPLRSVWPLLEMEKKEPAFIRSAFSFALGEVVDGVVVTSESQLPDTPAELRTTLGQALKERSMSGMGLRDQLAIYFFAGQLPAENLKLRTLETWEGWEKARSDVSLQYREPDCPVAVVNASQRSGLATSVSKIIEQSGYTVVRVTDDPDTSAESRIAFAGDSEICATKANALSHLFPKKVTVEADPAVTQTYRAKIILELGEDVKELIPVGLGN